MHSSFLDFSPFPGIWKAYKQNYNKQNQLSLKASFFKTVDNHFAKQQKNDSLLQRGIELFWSSSNINVF